MVIAGSLVLILVAVALLVAGVVGSTNALIVCSIVATVLAAIVLVIGVRQAPPPDPDAEPDPPGGATARLAPPAEPPPDPDGRRDMPRRAERGHDARSDRAAVRPDRGATMVDDPVGRGTIPSQAETDGRRYTDAAPVDADGPEPDALFDRNEVDFDIDRVEDTAADDTDAVDDERVDADDDEDPPDEPSAQVVAPSVASQVAMLDTDVLVVDGRPRYHVANCVHLLGRASEPIPVGEALELGFTPCGLCEPDHALLADARRG